MRKFYWVTVSIPIMAENEEEAKDLGADWIRSSDVECFTAEQIAEVDDKVEWLVKLSDLLCNSYTSWQERYNGLRRLYEDTWGVLLSEERWEMLMEAVERFGETILEECENQQIEQLKAQVEFAKKALKGE